MGRTDGLLSMSYYKVKYVPLHIYVANEATAMCCPFCYLFFSDRPMNNNQFTCSYLCTYVVYAGKRVKVISRACLANSLRVDTCGLIMTNVVDTLVLCLNHIESL